MEAQVGDGQSLTDIQNYLANFNKEISAGGQTYILAHSGDNVVQAAGQGSFVVAHTGDQLYETDLLPDVGDEGMAVPKTEQLGDGTDSKLKIEGGLQTAQLDPTLLNDAGDGALFNPIHITPSQAHSSTTEPLFTVQAAGDGSGTTTVTAQAVTHPNQLMTVQPAMASALQSQLVALQPGQSPVRPQMVTMSPGGQQLVAVQQPEMQEMEEEGEEEEEEDEEEDGATDGDGNYQTVTIVPSEVNQGGEVSYVLIVSQNDQEQKANHDGNIDMSVYDFKEEAKGSTEILQDDGTPKAVKVTPKKQISMLSSQLMCNYCNYTSPKRYLLTRHMKTHSEERPHKCHICDRGFKTVASLQNHINTHTGVRPHKCKECDAAFTTSGELVRHVRYRHTYEKPHKCPECDYASVELSKLKRHMRSHTGERPYQCPHCSYASPDTYKLKRHLRIHTGEKPYECEICHTRFTQSNSLKAHKLIHTGNKPIYQCELCPTTCGRKTDLKIHVQKLHTSELPLQCKKCGKSFPDRYTWKIHVKTHEGEKCFKCELCPYAALSQRHLESHLLTHTGEKPFECQECDQTFRQKQLLKRHRNLYHTPDYVPPPPKDKIHQCTECGKAFAHKGNLLRHRAGHDPDNEEYQEALANYKLERGPAYEIEAEQEEEEEAEEDEEELQQHDLGESPEQQVLVTQAVIGDGQNYQAEATGQIHMANINGQQVQLQLVNLNDENNTQVYIQIDNTQQLQTLMGGQHVVEAQHGQEEGEGEEEEEEEVQEGEHEDMEEGIAPIEADTPPAAHPVQMLHGGGFDVKQEEMKQEEGDTPVRRSRVRSGAQSPSMGGLRELAMVAGGDESVHQNQDELHGYMEQEVITDDMQHVVNNRIGKHSIEESETPTKRARLNSPRRVRAEEDDEEEERKRDEQKKKDIETCFGFEEL